MAPLARALAAQGLSPSLILTGQHPRLDLKGFGLDPFPAVSLECAGQFSPHQHVDQLFGGLFPLLRDQPDLVIVQGDTSSALAGALAAVAARVPLAHVEAGLRSHDIRQPWPEEEYRRRIDREAELLFAPTELAARNLRLEHVAGAIHVTGNTGIDALLEVRDRLTPSPRRAAGAFHLLATCHRRENWETGLDTLAQALGTLAADAAIRIELVLHPNPDVAYRLESLLGGHANIVLTLPCSHADLVRKMRDCDLLLSDSGGMQEEAPALGTPLLVLRDKTERPEGIASGNAELIGMDSAAIVSRVRELAADRVALARMAIPSYPYGSGNASAKIAGLVDAWLALRSRSRLRRA